MGEEIQAGSTVTIIGRGSTKISFDIQDDKSNVLIRNIWCEQLELQD